MKRFDVTRLLLSALLLLFSCYPGLAQVSVLTQHNDNTRTGQNLNETILNTSNVNVSNFGKVFWRTVDGYIFAQPLYVSGLNIGGATHNVVFVATEHNSVYAFDADDPNHPAPLWYINLGTPVPSDAFHLAFAPMMTCNLRSALPARRRLTWPAMPFTWWLIPRTPATRRTITFCIS